MATVTVRTIAALLSALSGAHAGDTILLAPGTFSGLSLIGINPGGNVTVTSQNRAKPANLTSFSVSNSSNLTFSHLEMSTAGVTNGLYAYRIQDSRNVRFDSDFVHGAIGADPNSAATGFLFRQAGNVSVTNSTFEYLQNGIMDLENNGVLFSGNSFSHMAADGIDNAGASNVRVLNNYFTDTVANTTGLHPDAIQFWNAGTTVSAENITISGNTYVRGDGIASQGIFIEDDNSLPYRDLRITNNTIIGAQYNGITVGGSSNAEIADNQVISYGDYQSFMLLRHMTVATVANNHANLFELTNNANLTRSGDVVNAVVRPGGAPTIADAAARATYQVGGAAVGIGHFLVVDTNAPSLASATVAITGGFLAGDALSATNQAGVTGSYNSATGVLTLSGTASQAAYQAVLDSVAFSSSASDPTRGGTDTDRTVSFSVKDRAGRSAATTAQIRLAPAARRQAPVQATRSTRQP